MERRERMFVFRLHYYWRAIPEKTMIIIYVPVA